MINNRKERALFVLGIVFFVVGISVDTIAMWILGIVFMVIGMGRSIRAKHNQN